MHRIIRLVCLSLWLHLLSGPLVAASYTAAGGQTVTLTASADGTAPFIYQWYKAGKAVSNATRPTLTLNSVSSTDAGLYTVKVSNGAGSVTSTSVDLVVQGGSVAPSVTTQPSNKSVSEGSPFSFTVAANGTGPLTYQWKKGGTAITGATSATYSVAAATNADAGSYTVTITNSLGSATSSAATLTVTAPVIAPTITAQPVASTVVKGGTASFSVTASGSATLTYQWYKNGAVISGATSSTYSISNVASTHAATYSVKVTNSAGNVTSSGVTLTVSSAAVAPTLTVDLDGQTIQEGDPLNLSVTASGTAPFTYQWRKGGINISGATGSSYSVARSSTSDSGQYSVVVSNTVGSVTSSVAAIVVEALVLPPTISTQPLDVTVTAGDGVSLSVEATGTGTLRYQWIKDGADVQGATSPTYSIAAATLSSAGTYTVYVWNDNGSELSSPASITVVGNNQGGSGQVGGGGSTPTILDQPASAEVAEGQSTTLAVTISGTGSASYQWYKNGSPITGAIFSTYTLSPVTSTSYGTYKVVATVGSTVLTSNEVSVTSPGTKAGRISNLSVRSVAGRGGQPLIVGFVTNGSSEKQVLVRATGPALAGFGVPGCLTDPKISLFNGNSLVTENDNWADGGNVASLTAAFQRLGAFALTDSGSKDTAILTAFNGLRTVHVNSTKAGESGVVLVEAYDADTTSTAELCNASALNYVGTGGEILVLGFVISGDTPKKILIRGVGPTLRGFGLSGVLDDPVLQIHRINNGTPELIHTNDDWDNSSETAAQFSSNGAFGLDASSKDSALVVTLNPGVYTASVSGKNSTTGTAIVELYAVK